MYSAEVCGIVLKIGYYIDTAWFYHFCVLFLLLVLEDAQFQAGRLLYLASPAASLRRCVQYVHCVMHKCIMVKVGGSEKHVK